MSFAEWGMLIGNGAALIGCWVTLLIWYFGG